MNAIGWVWRWSAMLLVRCMVRGGLLAAGWTLAASAFSPDAGDWVPPHHFVLRPNSSDVSVGQSVTVEIAAETSRNLPLGGIDARIALSGTVVGPIPSMLLGELVYGQDPTLELVNVSNEACDLAYWQIVTYWTSGLSRPARVFTIPGPAVCPPGGVVVVRSTPVAPGAFPSYSDDRLLPAPSVLGSVLLLDARARVVDVLAFGSGWIPGSIPYPAAVSSSLWSGSASPVPPISGAASLQRVGCGSSGGALDWTLASPSPGRVNAGLSLPFLGGSVPIRMEPGEVRLVDGQWRGMVRFLEPARRVMLRADDGAGHTGATGPIEVLPLPGLGLVLPARWSEALAGSTNATVVLPAPATEDVQVDFESSAPDEIEAADPVIVPAGATAATVTFRRLANTVLEGAQVVTVTARARGYAPAETRVVCDDDEDGVLALRLPEKLAKTYSDDLNQCEVSVDRPVAKAVIVELATDRPDILRLPDRVVIEAGDVRASFTVLVVDDYRFEDDLRVRVSAGVDGWQPASGEVVVSSPYPRWISLSSSASIEEGFENGVVATLRLAAAVAEDLPIRLSAEPPGVLDLPPRVTLPAGTRELRIPGSVPEDHQTNGTRRVTLRAGATGFTQGMTEFSVVDHDPHHLEVRVSATAVRTNEPVEIEVSVRNVSGDLLPGYRGRFTLAGFASGAQIDPLVGPSGELTFVGGIGRATALAHGELAGLVLVATTPDGLRGRSYPVDVLRYRVLEPAASALVLHPNGDRLYVSVPTATNGFPQGILELDPTDAASPVRRVIAVERAPDRLAFSHDGAFLYFSAGDQSGSVSRFDMAKGVVDLRWNLTTAVTFGPETGISAPYRVARLAPVAGAPRSVLVGFGSAFSSNLIGVGVFDDDRPRPDLAVFSGMLPDAASFDSAAGSRVYGLGVAALYPLELDARGVRILHELVTPSPNFERPWELDLQATVAEGIGYFSGGAVLALESLEALGPAPVAGPVIRDPQVSRLHYFDRSTGRSALVSLDRASLLPVARLGLPGADPGLAFDFVAWGRDGLAFRSWFGAIHLLNSVHLRPDAGSAEVAITAVHEPVGIPRAGERFQYAVVLENSGNVDADQVELEVVQPERMTVVDASPPAERGPSGRGIAVLRCGPIPAHGTAEILFTVQADGAMSGQLRLRVLTGTASAADRRRTIPVTVQAGTTEPRISRFWMDGLAMAYSPTEGRLYISSSVRGAAGPQLLPFDVASRVAGPPIPVPGEYLRLAISEDGQFLYGSAEPNLASGAYPNYGSRIDRLRLPDGSVSRQFGIKDRLGVTSAVVDLVAVPGRPSDLLVSRSGNARDVALYVDGVDTMSTGSRGISESLIPYPGQPGDFVTRRRDTGAIEHVRLFPASFGFVTVTPNSLATSPGGIWCVGGRVYEAGGVALDLATLTPVAGALLPGTQASVGASDLEADLLLVVCREADHWVLRAVRGSTSQPLWHSDALGDFHRPIAMAACGGSQFALLTDDGRLFLIDARQLPGVPVARLAIDQELVRTEGAAGGSMEVQARITVTNAGPETATGVVVVGQLSPEATLLDSSPPVRTPITNALEVRVDLGELPAGTVGTINLRFRPRADRAVTNRVSVEARSQDPDLADNDVQSVLPVLVGDADLAVLYGAGVRDIVYDPGRAVLYLSARGISSREGRILQLDPATRQLRGSWAAGHEPGWMALSAGGRFLHVALEGESAVERRDLTDGVADRRWGFGGYGTLESLAAHPRDDRLVAVALSKSPSSWLAQAVVILYRDGVPLPSQSVLLSPIDSLVFSADGSVLYAHGHGTGGSRLHRFSVDASGIEGQGVVSGLLGDYAQRVVLADDLVFTSAGEMVDPVREIVTGRFALGLPTYPRRIPVLAVDGRSGVAHFVVGDGEKTRWLRFRTSDGSLAETSGLPVADGEATAARTWGDRGVAMAVGGNLVLARYPGATLSDVAIQAGSFPQPLGIGAAFPWTLVVTNRGPAWAGGAVVEVEVPTIANVTGLPTASQGAFQYPPGKLVWVLGALAPGQSAQASLHLVTQVAGLVYASARLETETLDPVPADNQTTAYGLTVVRSKEPFYLPPVDLAAAPSAGVAYVACGAPLNTMFTLSPASLVLEAVRSFTSSPGPLAISADGTAVYVGLADGGVLEVDAATRGLVGRFDLGTNALGLALRSVALAALPPPARGVVVAAAPESDPTRTELLVIDRGVARARRSSVTGSIVALAAAPDGRMVHVGTEGGYMRYALEDDGLAATPTGPLGPEFSGRFSTDGERLFFDSGLVVDADTLDPIGALEFPSPVGCEAGLDRFLRYAVTNGAGVLRGFDSRTSRELWELPLNVPSSPASQVLSIGSGYAVIRTVAAEILCVGLEALPTNAVADLGILRLPLEPTPAVVGGDSAAYVIVGNAGPGSASAVRLSLTLPDAADWSEIRVPQGSCRWIDGGAICDLGRIPSGQSVFVKLPYRPKRVGRFEIVAHVKGEALDPDPTDDTGSTALLFNPVPRLTLRDTEYHLTSDRPADFPVPILASDPAGSGVSGTLVAQDVTAQRDVHYQLPRTNFSLGAGSTRGNVKVQIPAGQKILGERTFRLSFGEVTNARPASIPALIRILDDRVPTLTVTDAVTTEGNAGENVLHFDLSLSSSALEPVRVEYRTVDGTAHAGSDYRPAEGRLEFAPGVTRLGVDVDVSGDEVYQGDRELSLMLGRVENARATGLAATGRILDDDPIGNVVLTAVRLDDDGFHLQMTLPRDHRYQVESSATLETDSWSPVSPLLTGSGATVEFVDREASQLATRYYRLREIQ